MRLLIGFSSRRFLFGAWLLAGLTLGALPTSASPQALTILSDGLPMPLFCDAEGCRAHLPTLCLQRDRDPPQFGDPYLLAAGAVTPMRRDSEGGLTPIADAAPVTFASYGDYRALRAHWQPPAPAGADESYVLVIAPASVLLPVEQAGDPEAQAPEEIAHLMGPARVFLQRFAMTAEDQIGAIALMSRAVSALPERGQTLDFDGTAYWQGALASAERGGASPEALGLAREQQLETCQYFAVRRCIEARQGEILKTLNQTYWDETGGS